ncbi:MAG TPA: site-specific integrase, partial [Promineifilum sp.]|nr:site-specific integrase [Promineifilum sp.]
MEEQLIAFLSHLEQEYRYSENTIAAYRNDLNQFLEYVEGHAGSKLTEWSAVSDSDIEAYLTYMK